MSGIVTQDGPKEETGTDRRCSTGRHQYGIGPPIIIVGKSAFAQPGHTGVTETVEKTVDGPNDDKLAEVGDPGHTKGAPEAPRVSQGPSQDPQGPPRAHLRI